MFMNLLVAGVSGVMIPLMMKRFNIDPALAGGVLLTTITDRTVISLKMARRTASATTTRDVITSRDCRQVSGVAGQAFEQQILGCRFGPDHSPLAPSHLSRPGGLRPRRG